MSRPTLIAFCGDRGAGKDTACDALRLAGFEKLAFADPLREVTSIALGISLKEMTDRVLKETPLDRWPFMSPRDALKIVGTEGFRDNFPGVWINALKRRISDFRSVVVSDCRFADEAQAIKDMGGILVRIINPSITPSGDQHRSELEWQSFDYDSAILNDELTAYDFKMKVCRWLSHYSRIPAPV